MVIVIGRWPLWRCYLYNRQFVKVFSLLIHHVSWGWNFLCWSQIAPYISRAQYGINTENSMLIPDCTLQSSLELSQKIPTSVSVKSSHVMTAMSGPYAGIAWPLAGVEVDHCGRFIFVILYKKCMGELDLCGWPLWRGDCLHRFYCISDLAESMFCHYPGQWSKLCSLSCRFFGPKSLKVAMSFHLVARAHACKGDFRTGLNNEKEAYTIYKGTVSTHL